jgi:ribosomal protein L11
MADQLGSWDSSSATSNITSAITPLLQAGGVAPGDITVNVQETNNAPGNPVTVTVTIAYRPTMTFIFGNPTINLSASSRMYIAH